MKKLALVITLLVIAGIGYAVTTNPASAVTADSEATALTIPYRDNNGGGFKVGPLGLFVQTVAQLAARSDAAGAVALMSDFGPGYAICISTAANVHSYVYASTTTASKIGTECK